MPSNSKYIVVLKSGIGNQLFQYAYAKYLNIVEAKQVALYYRSRKDPYSREDIIKEFKPSIPYLSNRIEDLIAARVISQSNNLITKLVRSLAQLLGIRFKMRLQKGTINQYIKELADKDITILNGYWQNAEIVNSVKDELAKDLMQINVVAEDYLKLLGMMDKQKCPVAVHIRDFWFADHVTQSSSKPKENYIQQTLSKKYYQQAISKILEHNEAAFFFIFASDNDRAAEMIKEVFPHNKYSLVPNSADVRKDYEALILMSRCKSFIMSNSTFGWWGAWLSWARGDKAKDSLYLMPNRWDREDSQGSVSQSFVFCSQCLPISTD